MTFLLIGDLIIDVLKKPKTLSLLSYKFWFDFCEGVDDIVVLMGA